MKTKSLLIMLLMALFVPLAMNGQQTVTVYDGTNTNSYVPMYTYYCDYGFKSEYIIPASSLQAEGLSNGDILTSIQLYQASSAAWVAKDLTIKLSNTTTSSYSSTGLLGSSGTTVYTNSSYSANSASSHTFTFTTPFAYTGGSLIVQISALSGGTYKSSTWYGTTTTTNQGYYVYGSGSSSGSLQKFVPKTTFTYSRDPYIALSPATATVFTGFTETLTASYGNVSGTPTITYSSNNTSVATVTGNGTTATVTAVAPGSATITATMNGSYTATCAITVEDPSYCTPSFGSNDDCITNITLGNINNTTASSSTNGYGDYTSMSTELEPGTTATLSLTSGGGSGTHAAAVWIDFDNSYTFESSERVGTQGSISASATVSITLTIPADAAPGSHRMRVVYQYNVTATAIDPCASATYGEGEDYTVVITSPCPKPTGLTLSGITTHGVTATWDAATGDVFQYAMVMGANVAPSTVTTYDGSITATGTTCSMAWNTLFADTDYTLVLRKDCGNNDYSIAVAQSFTTLESACLKPTNVTASNITVNSAHISWDGTATSYNVRYATATVTGTTLEAVFEDGFESGLGNWTTYANGYDNTNLNWQTFDASQFDDGSNHGGSYSAMSRSWSSSTGDQSVDNWLVTPQMTLGNTLKFWVCTNGGFPDSYAVYVSTGSGVVPSSGTGDFTVVANLTPATGSWVEQTYDLSAYAGQQGYVAIRHKDNAKDHLLVDDFGVYNTINTYSYGTFTTLPPTSQNSCDITGLSPETLYVAQVQSDCGSPDGTSGWSSVYFTTPDACSAPNNLATTNITANTATLGWSDNQDSYNVQYRKVYFYESFEGETIPTGWTTIDANNDGNCWQIGSAKSHSGANGAYNISYVYQTTGISPDDYLVSPLLDLQGTLRVWLTGNETTSYAEHFAIYLSTTGNTASDFTTTLVAESTTTNSYVEYTADLSSYAGRQGYIAIRHFNCTDQREIYVDDFGLYGSENWVTVNPNPTDATTTLTGLEPNTSYEWQVQGLNCNSQGSSTDWSAVATFTTPEIPAVPVASITASDVNLLVGATATITATVLPADATNPAVTYTSADATIATVDANGLVTGVAAGNTTITIAATDGSNVTATINVSVANIDVTEITASDVTMITGETATISYTVTPSNATDSSVTFTSANPAIATVDASGVVTGVAIGTTTITIASVSNPEVTATINVTVTPDPNAVQFTLVAPATAQPGDVITVEAYMAAPTSGNYDGFTGLVLGIQFDTDAFEVYGNPTAGPVATACQMSMPGLPNENHPDLVQYSLVMVPGNPNTTTGLVFSAQFTVLNEVEFGDYTFTPGVTNGAANFIINMSNNPVQIPYEVTPSTVTIGLQTYTKTIDPYTSNGGYYLIASPLATEVNPTDVTGMITDNYGEEVTPENSTYDFYSFDQAQTLEWVNYRVDHFNLENGQGYLYASKNGTTLTFTGMPYSGTTKDVTLNMTSEANGLDFPGWNLVGNPFAVDEAYINRPFYRMEEGGARILATEQTGAIQPMEGVFVIAAEDGETMTFTTQAPGAKASIVLNLNQGRGNTIDRAIVSVGQGRTLPKFMFNPYDTKLYMPKNGEDYAVVRGNTSDDIPVSFEPAEDGYYNISVDVRNMNLRSLVLKDRVRNVNIDLLRTPTYQFKASIYDRTDRFLLTFRTTNGIYKEKIMKGANSEDFGFFSYGNWVIDNEGEATLQVIDLNGRVLSSENIYGSTSIQVDVAPGVYMLRLINGDNVKIQKVVVE